METRYHTTGMHPDIDEDLFPYTTPEARAKTWQSYYNQNPSNYLDPSSPTLPQDVAPFVDVQPIAQSWVDRTTKYPQHFKDPHESFLPHISEEQRQNLANSWIEDNTQSSKSRWSIPQKPVLREKVPSLIDPNVRDEDLEQLWANYYAQTPYHWFPENKEDQVDQNIQLRDPQSMMYANPKLVANNINEYLK